ncbi:MAG TPA: PAS domain S-box protein, partial [Vicinamibacterales bacterium]|nr:PAS domain S-box protein [Vicinamibacterales bacterium]
MSDPDPLTSDNHAWRTALLESSLDCVIIMDAAGRVVDLNAGTEATFGVTREQVIGQRLGDVFVPPELRAQHEAGLRRYLTSRNSGIVGQRVEVEALHASGRRLPVELSIVQLSGVEPPLFVGHLRDITERQGSERRLKASAAASRALATATAPGAAIEGVLRAIGEELHWHVVQLWRVDRLTDRIVLDASWMADGVDPAPYRTVSELRRGQGLPGTVWAAGTSRWIEDLQEETPTLPRFRIFTEAGVRSAVCFPVHASGITFAAIETFALQPQVKDPQLLVLLEAIAGQLGHVSAERAARDAIESSETALRDALRREKEARQLAEEANAGKDQFLAVISHELRTPLGPIMGWARLLQTSEPTPELRAKATAVILRNAELQSRLVEDLLDV